MQCQVSEKNFNNKNGSAVINGVLVEKNVCLYVKHPVNYY